jgi:A/G-specific adenine glycosylase
MQIPLNDIFYIRRKILDYSDVLYDSFEWRNTSNLYHALAAEIMLQRTKAEQVLPVYIHFSQQYQTPQDYIQKGSENIFTNLGLLHRYKQFVLLSETLSKIKKFPNEKQEILKLPGVGEYVASAICSLHLNQRDILVDSNIVRLYGRFFGIETDHQTRRKTWIYELAEKITPIRKFKQFNYGLLDFTRKICKPKPLCIECRIKKKCRFN